MQISKWAAFTQAPCLFSLHNVHLVIPYATCLSSCATPPPHVPLPLFLMCDSPSSSCATPPPHVPLPLLLMCHSPPHVPLPLLPMCTYPSSHSTPSLPHRPSPTPSAPPMQAQWLLPFRPYQPEVQVPSNSRILSNWKWMRTHHKIIADWFVAMVMRLVQQLDSQLG